MPSATGAAFPPTSARLAFDAGSCAFELVAARGAIATPVGVETPARWRP